MEKISCIVIDQDGLVTEFYSKNVSKIPFILEAVIGNFEIKNVNTIILDSIEKPLVSISVKEGNKTTEIERYGSISFGKDFSKIIFDKTHDKTEEWLQYFQLQEIDNDIEEEEKCPDCSDLFFMYCVLFNDR